MQTACTFGRLELIIAAVVFVEATSISQLGALRLTPLLTSRVCALDGSSTRMQTLPGVDVDLVTELAVTETAMVDMPMTEVMVVGTLTFTEPVHEPLLLVVNVGGE